MQHSQRLDQRLRVLREEVRTMTQEKEQGERVWRDRLQRCQRQLKAKEDEMSRQSLYFENFKAQLHQKLSTARDREQSLQNRIYALEKQLLDMTVSAATGMGTVGAVRITAGTAPRWEEQDRLPSMRGEGEGEEERKEERRRQWQPSVGTERGGEQDGDEGKTEKETGRAASDEARLQGFILSLQEDLRVLLEREEDGMTERRELTEQLQEAQEKSHLLGCKMEELKLQVHQLKLSEGSLMQEVEELREESHRLQEILTQTADLAPSHPESTSPGPGSSCRPAVWSPGDELQPAADVQPYSPAVPPVHHKAAAESKQSITAPHSSSAKSGTPPTTGTPLTLFQHCGSAPSLQSLPLTTETLDELRLGTWCSGAILNLEESPSEECDALRDAYRSLGLGEDLQALQEQRDGLEAALQHMQGQLQVLAQENTQLKLQIRTEVEQGHPQEKIALPTSDGAEENTVLALAQDDLVQALNKENRALADRIQELLAHIELREEEIKTESTQLREQISRLEADGVRLEQENQEQGCLITELTQKTEDDLNTIMELQQRLTEGEEHIGEPREELRTFHPQSNLEEYTEDLVESVLKVEEPLDSNQQTNDWTAASSPGSQHDNHSDVLHDSPRSSLDISSLTDQVGLLSRSIQSLKTEQEELSASVTSLREQQREVERSVQTQTEAKQQLTRTVWALKEERDDVSRSLAALKQEREQLGRTVCVLKDEKDQCRRSTCGLKEERAQLTESLSGLEREKEKLLESLSGGREERDQIAESIRCLQTEREQLRQALLHLKQERDVLVYSLKCLREQRDEEQSSHALQEDRDALMDSVCGLRGEKERIEFSIRSLKREEEQIKQQLEALRKERNGHKTAPISQIQPEERHPNSKVTTKMTEGECLTLSCPPGDHRGNSSQEQSDLTAELEALKAELKKSQDEVEKLHIDTAKLQGQLCESEEWRTEAESHTAQADGRVKELQGKLTGLVREKAEAVSLKTQLEEQYNVLAAQLKAKTVALEELNSEYIALKQGQGNREDLSAVLVSLRARYDDIRAKYDALLKKRSQNELDLTPLKAKLSCLVVKCQERNRLLVQMVKAMHRHGIADASLTQQVEQLLSDAALQDYTTAFTPSSNGDGPGFTPGFISKFQGWFTPACPHEQHGLGSGVKCSEPESANQTSLVSADTTTRSSQDGSEVTPVQTGALQKTPGSATVQETPSTAAPVLTDSLVTQLSANTTAQATSESESSGYHHADTIEKSSPDLSRLSRSSPSPTAYPSSPGGRLSSPEKIINLQEQLQKALKSSFQGPAGRGRGQQPKRGLSFLASVSQTERLSKQGPSWTARIPSSLPSVPTAPLPAEHTPAATNTLTPANKSTLFNAVASRSAHVTLSPDVFTKHQSKADRTTSGLSTASTASTTAKSTLSNGPGITRPPKASQNVSAVPDISPALTLRTWDSDVLISSDTNPKTTASKSTARPASADSSMPTKTNSAADAFSGVTFATSCTLQSALCSPERPKKSAQKSLASSEKTKTARPKPEAPASVRSVEVIKTVGQSSLLIGWERPPLDELGCSNGTFVYGYRVFVDGDFHKSVMSSACTKCILENVDLSVPVHIGVQTLGSNGLTSHSVHTTYRMSELH